ncbi:hypothetical protein QBC34DRAFT_433392 [Podospora aff. communis PSN243]|uniref:Ubiquitin 3 binding protein But2 C-terminal domain-containing protein n=1 Tax=Podospora aff. communis PSN243 TaxID=3040156 RepID=A0AAV9H389_9PEZI|nr:hypothetical protein QBC34DRAFT_433392 [Podospora aff. communis PSN243]
MIPSIKTWQSHPFIHTSPSDSHPGQQSKHTTETPTINIKMQLATLLLASFSIPALAFPTTPNPPASQIFTPKRTCAGLQYAQLRNAPTQPLPFALSVNSNNPSPVEIGFAIPSGAVGPCSLMLSLPAAAQVQGGAQIDVIALDGPAQGALVGTTQFVSGGAATINSFACREQMCYSLGISGGGQGAVQFMEGAGTGVGVVMTYDC